MARPINVSKSQMEKIMGEKTPTTKTIKIVGNAMVLTSKLQFATIQKLEKYNPKALCLEEVIKDEVNEVFRIGTGKVSSIGKYGITFAETNKEGFATATILLPNEITNKKEFIKDNFASTIFMLKGVEDCVITAIARLDADFAELDDEIEEE